MNSTFKAFYQEELIALRQYLSHKMPAPDWGAQYPAMMHLLESIAYVTAKQRQRLDFATEQLCQSTLDLLFPHYLKPLPGSAIAQFEPDTSLDAIKIIPSQTPLTTTAHAIAPMRFSTCEPTHVIPWSLSSLSIDTLQAQNTSLTFHLSVLNSDQTIQALKPTFLSLYVHADPWLTEHLLTLLMTETVKITLQTPEHQTNIPLTELTLSGFDRNPFIPTHEAQTDPGYALLSDFFHFQNAFYFLKLHLPQTSIAQCKQTLSITFHLRAIPHHLVRFIKKERFLLHCVPIVNLFTLPGKPIHLTHHLTNWPLLPDGPEPDTSYLLHSIQSLTAQNTACETCALAPFGSAPTDDAPTPPTWLLHRTPEPCITLIDPQKKLHADHWTLQSQLCYSNSTPIGLDWKNNADKTLAFWHAAQDAVVPKYVDNTFHLSASRNTEPHYQEILLTHLQLNQATLTTNTLKQLLHRYARDTHQHALIDAIQAVDYQQTYRPCYLQHQWVHSACLDIIITLTLDNENAFRWILLVALLNRFFILRAPIHLFTQLTVHNARHEEIYQCPLAIGKKIPF